MKDDDDPFPTGHRRQVERRDLRAALGEFDRVPECAGREDLIRAAALADSAFLGREAGRRGRLRRVRGRFRR